jgi:hypothetical protein
LKAHAPVEYDLATLLAVKALREGKANEGQQRLAMQWIELVACDVEGMSYHDTAEGGERATAFHEGRRFVGNQIRKMSNPITLAALERAGAKARKPRIREAT